MSPTIKNTTIAGNKDTGAGQGGGIAEKFVDGPTLIDGSTIAGNSSAVQGGGVALIPQGASAFGPVTITNTILGDNSAPAGPDFIDNRSALSASLGFDLLETPPAGSPTTVAGPNIVGLDAGLQPLAANGGPTQTMAITTASPAFERGSGSGTDQRGVLRPIDFPGVDNAAGGNGADIGAFELQPSTAGVKLGKLKRKKHKGTGIQTVVLPVPDAGSVTVTGKNLKKQTVAVKGAAKVSLKLIPKGKLKRKLRKSGKGKVKATFTYNATGTAPVSLSKAEKLKQKLRGHRKH